TLTLQQSIAVGFARSPLLAQTRSDVAIQAAAVRLQRAGLLPSLAGSADYTKSHQQPGGFASTNAAGVPISSNRNDNFASTSFGVSLRQLIYDGGRIAAAVNAAQRSETAFADTYRRELQVVAYNVAQAYYAYLGAQRTTQVDLEIVRQDVVQENLVRAQVSAGTEARATIATAQLPTAQARLAVVRAQGAELADEAAFANAMGLDANVRVQPVDDAPVFTNSAISTVPIPTYDAAVQRAIALRPDFDSSRQVVQQDQYTLKSAKLGLFPSLATNASATDNSSDQFGGSFRNAQSIGVSLAIPIYDQGITAANVASARAQLDVANAVLQNTTLDIQLNVKQALTNLVSSRAALAQTQQEYRTAVVNVQSTQAQYRAGVTTLPLLLNAQVQLTTALTDQVTAVYTLRQAEQAYLFAVGANYETPVGDAPLPARPTPDPQPTGTPPPPTASTSPVPIPSGPVILPSATPIPTASPRSSSRSRRRPPTLSG
ncbi:MAG: TolC family protein, partial [Candidatus Eremiobacteraeota bacterium]|nr:TolC family protein [Candidatus Eremiobacteraeota bacterium]